MPNIKSAKKRVIVNENNAMRNKATRSELRTAIKKADAAKEDRAKQIDKQILHCIDKSDIKITVDQKKLSAHPRDLGGCDSRDPDGGLPRRIEKRTVNLCNEPILLHIRVQDHIRAKFKHFP